jgi:glycosyltransferase involved in cell wall biosynthesis
MLATVHRLRKWTDVAQVDIFSGAAFQWAEIVTRMLMRHGTPMVLTLHGGGLPAFARKHSKRVTRVMQRAAHITAPSPYLQQGLDFLGIPIDVLPNPVDLGALQFRHRVSIAPTLVWLRAMHAIYNPLMAVDVLARVRIYHPNASLMMVGPDKGDGSLTACKNKAENLGIGEAVTFVGAVPKSDVPAWLDKGDIFINTTTVDNTPVSVLEALAQGCCVVSTNVGGMPYLLENGSTGLLVPSNDVTAMSDAILGLLANPETAAALSKSGSTFASKCDYPLILDHWEACLSKSQSLSRTEGKQD